MDIFMDILAGLMVAFFLFFGVQFFFRGQKVIRQAKRLKFGKDLEARPQEILVGRIIGVLLFLIGLYYLGVLVLAILNR